MNKHRNLPVFLLLTILFTLTACGGQGEQDATEGTVYTSHQIEFTPPTGQTVSTCISGENVYFLNEQLLENRQGSIWTLSCLPVEGGETEELVAFHPAQLKGDVEYETVGGCLRPGADGTIWLTESVYISGQGTSLVLRQLDSNGNELLSYSSAPPQQTLGAEQLYDLWTDGQENFFLNTGDAVVLLDKSGNVQATLDGGNMSFARFVILSDGRAAILTIIQTPGAYTSSLRVIDPDTRSWAEDTYPLPANAVCFQSLDKDVLFYYEDGSGLYLWRKGAAEAELIINWAESGILTNGLAALSFLPDDRIATAAYVAAGVTREAQLIHLTVADTASMPDRTMLTFATISLNGTMQSQIADFNNNSDSCYISVKEYLPNLSLNTSDAELEQAWLKMGVDLLAGNAPDIIDMNSRLPIRRMEATGLLEDLWPYIKTDPELGREALMQRPLQAMECDGKLYRIGDSFAIDTIIGPKNLMGDRMAWTYDDFQAMLERVPEEHSVLGSYENKSAMLEVLVTHGGEYFVDWKNGTSQFDEEEFRSLLEFCNCFPDVSENSGQVPVEQIAIYTGDQLLMAYPLSGVDEIQYHKALFGGEISYVGWPNAEGSTGSSFKLFNQISIAASSPHKEEAWSFLRTFLLPHDGSLWDANQKATSYQNKFFINKTDFERSVEFAMTPILEEVDGILQEVPRTNVGFTYRELDMGAPIDALTQEEYDQIMALYNTAEGTSDYDRNLINIITEQAGAYFAGDRSLDDTVAAIQSRVGLYLAELQ